jgi:hypothetical protein
MVTTALDPGWAVAIETWSNIIAPIIVGVAVVAILAMLGFILKASMWAANQMKTNGEAKKAGTADKTLRETLDKIKGGLDDNTEDTKVLAQLTENVRRQMEVRAELIEERTEARHSENQAALTEMADGFKSHLAWSDQVVVELRAMIVAVSERVDVLEARHDQRMPRLEVGDDG